MQTLSETDLLSILTPLMSKSRLDHSKRVAKKARDMAPYFKCNPEKAVVAGLVHDVAKAQTPDTLLEMGLKESDVMRKTYNWYPKVWHAFVAPTLITYLFKITDPEILNAAKYHTTGKARMGAMTSLLFLADFLESGSPKDPIFKRVEKELYKGIPGAILEVANFTITKLNRHGLTIHPLTINCRNYYAK